MKPVVQRGTAATKSRFLDPLRLTRNDMSSWGRRGDRRICFSARLAKNLAISTTEGACRSNLAESIRRRFAAL